MPVLPKLYQHFSSSLATRFKSSSHKASFSQPRIAPSLGDASSRRHSDAYALEMLDSKKHVLSDERSGDRFKEGGIETDAKFRLENASSSMSCCTGTTLKSTAGSDDLV